MPAITPGMAAANPSGRQPAAGQRALRTNGVHRVLRTTWGKTAAAVRPEQKNKRRRNRPAIYADGKYQNRLGRIHRGFSKPARCNVVKKSLSTSSNLFPAIEFRATSTNSTGWAKSFWCRRKLSRSNRRARLRTTAPPIFRLVTTPNRGVAPSGNACQLAMRQPSASRCPCCRTRAKSRCCWSRAARRSRSRPAAGVRRLASGDEAGMNTRIKRASDACVPRGGGCAEWHARSWWNCGREIRAAVCAGFLMADTGVS